MLRIHAKSSILPGPRLPSAADKTAVSSVPPYALLTIEGPQTPLPPRLRIPGADLAIASGR
jgi:hypothetical protein